VKLPIGCSSEDVLVVVREWVVLLAKEKYEEAYQMTFHADSSLENWTPELMQTLVTNYGSCEPMRNGTTYRVTALNDEIVSGRENPYREVNFFEKKNRQNLVGHVDFDLPLNGEWSDVTAIFNILEIEGSWVLWLEDIHVL